MRRTRPSRGQARNLTAFERATGWRCSIIVTNIPAARGIPGVPDSHRPVHRCTAPPARRRGERRAHREMDGPPELPSKTWVVNCGSVLAANIAAGLPAWCRLLGLYDCDDLNDAEPDTLRPAAEPARPARPPRPRPGTEDQPHLAMEGGVPDLLAAAVRPARTCLTRDPRPRNRKGGRANAVRTGEHIGQAPPPAGNQPTGQNRQKTGTTRSVTNFACTLNHRGQPSPTWMPSL